MRWSYVLTVQVDRLYAARAAVMESHREVMRRSVYEFEDTYPFFVMDAEAHFTLVAARQLMRALLAFDGDLRLPDGMSHMDVRTLRDALEHWDEPDGRAARQMQERGADPTSHQWSVAGPGLLGQLVSDAALRSWGESVHDDLRSWDPW
jgi:hypothetical protein